MLFTIETSIRTAGLALDIIRDRYSRTITVISSNYFSTDDEEMRDILKDDFEAHGVEVDRLGTIED